MLDRKYLREHTDTAAELLARKDYTLAVEQYRDLEQQRRSLQTHTEQLQSNRNQLAKKIGMAKAQGLPADELLQQASQLGEELDHSQQALKAVQQKFTDFLLYIPNIPAETVPKGKSEQDNVVQKKCLEPTVFDFEPKDHCTLAGIDRGIDMPAAAALSGSRFTLLRGEVALLHRALSQWMLDLHVHAHGYTEVNVPVLVHAHALEGTGQLPKFKEDQFWLDGENPHVLIPTAEVPLTNLAAGKTWPRQSMPQKYCAHSLCFRREAGSYGKDTHGLMRLHQFEKVELVKICQPENSYAELEQLTENAEAVLSQLQLPFQRVELCDADLGFSAAKTYDLEVWMPSEQRYREISSCSNTTDFQSRRLGIRTHDNAGNKVLAHCLNGSGVAVGRALIAVLENYQQADGSVLVPEVLRGYMRGTAVILKPQ